MDLLPDEFTVKCSNRLPMMIDLARLLIIRQLFEEGAEQVIWFDADVLIFSPQHFDVDLTPEQVVGRKFGFPKQKLEGGKPINMCTTRYSAFDEHHQF